MEIKKSQLRTILTFTVPALIPAAAQAQVKDFSSVMSQWTSYLKGGSEQIFLFVTIICVFIGVFQLLVVYPKFSNGDQHSAAAFLKHGGGLIIVVMMLNLFKILI